MNKAIRQKIVNLLLLIVELVLMVLGFWALKQDVVFLTTKKESYAEIIKVEKFPLPDPYKITVKYYNDYERKYVIAYVDDIPGRFGEQLPSKHFIKIYYKKYSPKVIYLIDYKYPNGGYLALYIVFLIVIIVAIVFQIISLKNSNPKFQ